MRCKGLILKTLVLKLYDAMDSGQDADAVARAISADYMRLLADCGQQARVTCWGKGYVLAMGHKLEGMAGQHMADAELRAATERLVQRMDKLFAKLPNKVQVDLSYLGMEVFNHACEVFAKADNGFTQTSILGQVFAQMNRIKL